jgi:hypothetical protein
MPYRLPRVPTAVGDCRFESTPLSNRWHLLQGHKVLAELQRVPSRHVSLMRYTGSPEIVLRPAGWGTVVAIWGNHEIGRVVRRSWWGRHWHLSAQGFACDLTSDPRPRHWSLRFGTEPVGHLGGGLLSYNHVKVHTDIAVPLVCLALAWHVLARPWEAAAAPGTLVPERAPATYRLVRPGA